MSKEKPNTPEQEPSARTESFSETASPDGEAQKSRAQELAENPDSWPLQADRMAIQFPLVDTLRMIAGHYGRRASNASLMAGNKPVLLLPICIVVLNVSPLSFIQPGNQA